MPEKLGAYSNNPKPNKATSGCKILDSLEAGLFDGGSPLHGLRKKIACTDGHRVHLPFEMVLYRPDLDHEARADTLLSEVIQAKVWTSLLCAPWTSEEWPE
jgi:hypothetical protein